MRARVGQRRRAADPVCVDRTCIKNTIIPLINVDVNFWGAGTTRFRCMELYNILGR